MAIGDDKGYARCKACDKRMFPAKNDLLPGGFEDLCATCLGIVRTTAKVDPHLYYQGEDEKGNKTYGHWDAWDNEGSDQSDRKFIDGFLSDKLGGPSDNLYAEDEYLEYGEGAFGDLGLFDSYE